MMDPWQSAGPAKGTGARTSLGGDTDKDTAPSLFDAAPSAELDEGRRRRDDALRDAEAATWTGTRKAWEEAIRHLAATRTEPWTSDDVRDVAGDPLGCSPQAVGAMMNAACRRGVIVAVGFAQSRRPERHGSWIRTYRGVR